MGQCAQLPGQCSRFDNSEIPDVHINVPKAMTIAGSDSGGGAGIQADLKTFFALGVYGSSVLTAITAQNTIEVAAIAEVPDEVVIAQIDTVAEDIGAVAVKTGMLSSASIIQNVADRLEAWGIPWLVVDPVMVSKSGATLLNPNAVDALKRDLLPLASIVTPNIPEAEILAGLSISNNDGIREAARRIYALGPKIVVVKGGHRDGPAVDLVFDGAHFLPIEGERIDTRNTHGTGCTFSAAIVAFLAHGLPPTKSIQLAKRYLEAALRTSNSIGKGHSPVNHATPLPIEITDAIAVRR
ncbi:MAG: bifunctional hydroxymethylpyrimidine kinase/phosphomethylpyrimidine kinase [Chloroflexia bacterium]|nr:bifunctional hydroxymethylpyrimidine kinase/phosphomethylpyrimidine kinase [Chloroflexia bacterium]